jgi:hypothetical protein
MPKLLRDRTLPALCPFCRQAIPTPQEVQDGQWHDFQAGFCACGAAFALDPTARNGGAVMLQAMLMACQGDMDRVLSLSHGVDYDEGHVHRYNSLTHRCDPNAFGTLYFIRLRPRPAGERAEKAETSGS